MPRVKRGNKRLKRRKKILAQAKGYWGTKSKLHRAAKEQVLRSLAYSYRDRRQRKRDFRRLELSSTGKRWPTSLCAIRRDSRSLRRRRDRLFRWRSRNSLTLSGTPF